MTRCGRDFPFSSNSPPFLSIISDQQIEQDPALMGQQSDAKSVPRFASALCQRTGSTSAYGSIASLGSQYVLGLKAVNCHTGDSLAEEQTTADSKEQVLNRSRKLRRKCVLNWANR